MRRPMFRGLLFAALAALAALAAACTDDPQVVDPTPNPTPTTETFSGIVTINGAITWGNINVSMAGSANATLTAVRPELTMRVTDGTGNFLAGETAFIGNSIDDNTGTVVVHGWNPATGTLFLNNRTGTLPTGQAIVGATSGARWTNNEVGNTLIGIALGVWTGTTCDLKLVNDLAGQGAVVTGVVRDAGSLCARAYDVGRLLSPAEVTLEVQHY